MNVLCVIGILKQQYIDFHNLSLGITNLWFDLTEQETLL